MNDIGFHAEMMCPGYPMSLSGQLRAARFVEGMDCFGRTRSMDCVLYIVLCLFI